MSQVEVEFQYNGLNFIIKGHEDQKMIEICNAFIKKSNSNYNELLYYYDSNIITHFDNNITFNQLANPLDKQRKKMNILVRNEEDNNDINNDKSIMKSKNIICPENPNPHIF